MKKIITMIGMGAVLCMVPACKKSNITPAEAKASNETMQRAPGQPLPGVDNTTMYVSLTSLSCLTPQKEYTSLIVDITGIRVYSAEHGWQILPTIISGWDLVSMQQGTLPRLNITDRIKVNPGRISKVAITFGDNSRLEIANKPVTCFSLGAQQVTMDVKGEIKENAVNELLLSMDICGHIDVHENSNGTNCYILNPVAQFEHLTQKMIK